MTKKQKLDSYYSYLNKSLLNHLPEGLNLVLDIGCGSGALGKEYKSKNKKSLWHGVDLHKAAITEAKKNLNDAWVMDANKLAPNATMKKKKYDALVYSLSLEQLENPDLALKDHVKLLKKGGQIYICFPNIQHWSLIRHLISGNWDYDERGILQTDNHHFFTRKSFARLLESIDLKNTDMFRYSYENTALFRKRRGARTQTLSKLKDLCLSTELKYNENDLRTYHYVMVAERK